ncbi:hypothetical protein BDW69DRAFT_165172 [Aspergillus filifer]
MSDRSFVVCNVTLFFACKLLVVTRSRQYICGAETSGIKLVQLHLPVPSEQAKIAVRIQSFLPISLERGASYCSKRNRDFPIAWAIEPYAPSVHTLRAKSLPPCCTLELSLWLAIVFALWYET